MTHPESPKSSISTFLVERYWPGVTRPALNAAVERVRRVLPDPPEGGEPVTHVATLLIDADEVVFCLFEATSREAVEAINERADFPFDRIVEGTWLAWAGTEGRPRPRARSRRATRSRLSGVAAAGMVLLSACSAGAPVPASSTAGSSPGGASTIPGNPASSAVAPGGGATALDQCSFLTAPEIETGTGLKVVRSGPDARGISRCIWTLSGDGNQIGLSVDLDDPRAMKNQEFDCTVGDSLARIDGVGDSACGSPISGGEYLLYALRADDRLTLRIAPTTANSVDPSVWATLARSVLAKLP